MNITEIAPKQKGLNSLHELSELIERQGFYIGQEAFYKSKYFKEKVVISGYLFELKEGRLQLGYCVETVASINRVLDGNADEPNGYMVGIDDLIVHPVHQPMCFVHHSGVAVNKPPLQAMNSHVQKS